MSLYTHIKKRNGSIASFQSAKITTAIVKAGQATGEFGDAEALDLTQQALTLAQRTITNEVPSVEELQDVVETTLLSSPYKKTAKAYILYREQRSGVRHIADAAQLDLVDQYLSKLDWQVKENSNMSYSLQGLHNYVSSEVSKVYWLQKIYPEQVRNAHTHGDLHLHDLGFLSVYCVGWDLYDLLTEGFTGVTGKVQSKPAKHFRAALGQVVNFFYTLQGEAAGAQAFSNFDTLLAPYIRYDDLSYEQVKQAIQEFLFNINVPTRVGFQTPFTNITLDLTVPSYYANSPVMIGGQPQKETYSEFQAEMSLFNKALIEAMAEGDARGRVFPFPIPTYNITKDFNWDEPTLDSLWEATAKYGLPYFSNFVNSDMNPEDARSMCCRLRIDNRQLEKRGGGLFGANPLTGSIGVVTINLPRIGYRTKTKTEFFSELAHVMDIAKTSLEIKRKTLEQLTDKGLYPYTKFYLRNIKAKYDRYWENHFSTIGLLGMNEAIENLMGVTITDPAGHAFAQEVLSFMRDRMLAYQEETGNKYNLEATPAEGTSYRLALSDQKRFDDIIFANGQGKSVDAPFYTNSTHLPVHFTDDMFTMLDLQDDLQSMYTGGTVAHLFMGERIGDPKMVAKLVKRICETYRLPYFTFTPTFSICQNHGYVAGEHFTCPSCESRCEVYSRIVGYLSPVEQWNNGKAAEFAMRKTYPLPQETSA